LLYSRGRFLETTEKHEEEEELKEERVVEAEAKEGKGSEAEEKAVDGTEDDAGGAGRRVTARNAA